MSEDKYYCPFCGSDSVALSISYNYLFKRDEILILCNKCRRNALVYEIKDEELKEYECELCGGKADFYGHIHFLDRPHVYYFCAKCLEKVQAGEYGNVGAISIYEKIDNNKEAGR